MIHDFIHEFWYQFSLVYETHEEYCKFIAGLQGSHVVQHSQLIKKWELLFIVAYHGVAEIPPLPNWCGFSFLGI